VQAILLLNCCPEFSFLFLCKLKIGNEKKLLGVWTQMEEPLQNWGFVFHT
jgi:hypothetical protein